MNTEPIESKFANLHFNPTSSCNILPWECLDGGDYFYLIEYFYTLEFSVLAVFIRGFNFANEALRLLNEWSFCKREPLYERGCNLITK